MIKGRAARTVAGESVMRKLPKAAPKAVVTGKGARLGGEGAKAVVATKQAAYRSASAKSRAAGKESAKYGYKNEPYNPKNFFGGSAVRAANMAKASPEKLAEFKSLQKASSAFSRNRLKAGKASVELSNKAYGMKGAANASRPGTMLRPKSPKPAAPAKAKAAPKVKTDVQAIKQRRQRALAPKSSTYLSQKLNTRSAVVRSAANAIYNRQARGVKELFGGKNAPTEIIKNPIGIMPVNARKGTGRLTNKDRALANLEAARKRVLSGRKGRR